jgi:hypothetical protein
MAGCASVCITPSRARIDPVYPLVSRLTAAEAKSLLKGERGEKEVLITNDSGATVGVRSKDGAQWNWYLDLSYFDQ